MLGLLAEAAGSGRSCVLWTTRSGSTRRRPTLAFVARRLVAESVAMVFAVREPAGAQLAGLPELALSAVCGRDDARALLGPAIRGRLDERVRDRIIAETRGNPLALLELPQGLTPAELAGGFGLPGPPALAGRIERASAGGSGPPDGYA